MSGGTPAPPMGPIACPLCSRAPMKTRPAGKSVGEQRRCPACKAEFRETGPDRWRLEYLSPDLFHGPDARAGSAPPLLQVRSWHDWSGSGAPTSSRPLPAAEAPATGLEPGEQVVATFYPARVVLPQSHTPWHGKDAPGQAWVTDRAIRVRVGEFRWTAPLSEVRAACNIAGTVELLAGPTDEPFHLLLADPAAFVAAVEEQRSKRSP